MGLVMKSVILTLSLLFLLLHKGEAVKSCLVCGSIDDVSEDEDCLAGNDNVVREECPANAEYGCTVSRFSNSDGTVFGRGCSREETCVNIHEDQDGQIVDMVCCMEDNCNTMDPYGF